MLNNRMKMAVIASAAVAGMLAGCSSGGDDFKFSAGYQPVPEWAVDFTQERGSTLDRQGLQFWSQDLCDSARSGAVQGDLLDLLRWKGYGLIPNNAALAQGVVALAEVCEDQEYRLNP